MNYNENDPLMFINTVSKIRNSSPVNYKYEHFKTKNKDTVDFEIEKKISEFVIKYESGYIAVVEIVLKTGEILDGIIRRKNGQKITIKTRSDEILINIKDIKNINIVEM